jgi:BirA family biotin operon repressor/biotin-[acetyl-CoA-carboxylase] ligase
MYHYTLHMPADELAAVMAELPVGWQGHYFAEVDSTQDEARAAARLGAPGRSIFVADFQRAGRGRHERSWVAAPGDALLVSLLFHDRSVEPVPWRWTSLASVSLAESVEALVPPLRVAIKWPNDLLLSGRKVAGILAETRSNGEQLQAIVGVGVNVRTGPEDLARVGRPATSLREASGQNVDRARLLLAFLQTLDRWLDRPSVELYAAWEARLWGRGQRLRLHDLGLEEDVVVLGADPDGSLRVRLSDGTERRTTTGELIC